MSKKHGANLFELSKQYNFDINNILDFSSNINPFGASRKALGYVSENIDMVSIYPDPEYISLKNAISGYSECKAENIILSNGATSLISNYIKYVSPSKSLLIQPAYSEYESELEAQGSEICRFYLDKDSDFVIDAKKMTDFINENQIDLVILCNPNNPTGTIVSRSDMLDIITGTRAKFLIDETYIEFSEKDIFTSSPLTTENPNLFVIRGTSKFFGTPGIRLGYAITSDSGAKDFINSKFNLWDINIIASAMGEIMFTDTEYINDTFKKISEEMIYLKSELSRLRNLKVYPSSGNFILCEILRSDLDASDVYGELIKKGIAIRNCSSFNGLSEKFFRICTLRHSENELLISELEKIFNKNE